MRIAIFFFFYNMTNGVLVNYLPKYYQTLHVSGTQLGAISSLSNIALIFVPPVWGIIADRTQRPAALLKLSSILAFLSFVPLLYAATFTQIVVVMALYSILLSPVVTLADTVAVREAQRLGVDYGRLRMWGTIGYIVSVSIFGWWVTHGGHIHAVPALGLMLIASYTLAAAFNHEPPAGERRAPPQLSDARRLLEQPEFLVFLLSQLIHWMALSPYYVLFTIHLTNLKLPQFVGIAIAVSAGTEVLLMFGFGAIRRRVPILLLLSIAALVSSVRWFCNAQLESGPGFVAIQALHCFSFGACYVGSFVYLERIVPPQLLATGRALFSAVVLGLGGVCGNMLAGKLYDVGGGGLAFRASGFLDLLTPLLLFVSWRLAARKTKMPAEVVAGPSPAAE